MSQTGNSWARTRGAPCRRAPGGGPFDSKASSAPERAPSVAGPVTPRHSVASPTWARPVIGQLPVSIRPLVLYIAWKHQFGVETRLTRLDSPPPPRPPPRRARPTRPSFPRTTLPLPGERRGVWCNAVSGLAGPRLTQRALRHGARGGIARVGTGAAGDRVVFGWRWTRRPVPPPLPQPTPLFLSNPNL